MLREIKNEFYIRKRREEREYLDKLEKELDRLRQENKIVEAEKINKEMVEYVLKKVKSNSYELKHIDFDEMKKFHFPKPGQILAESEEIVLIAIDQSMKNEYLNIRAQYDIPGSVQLTPEQIQNMNWKECTDNTKSYGIIKKGTNQFIGYIALTIYVDDYWELSCELDGQFVNKGYGYMALKMLLDSIYALTNHSIYISRVYPDNIASRKVMNKINAIPNRVEDYGLYGEALKEFQEEYLHLINTDLEKVAKEFRVEPKELLGRVLEYRIVWS